MGVRPMKCFCWDLVAVPSYDVIAMLKKGRQEIIDCRAEVEAERVDAVPTVFSKIHIKFVVIGNDLKENQVKRAVDLSAEKYCSASIMLGAALP